MTNTLKLEVETALSTTTVTARISDRRQDTLEAFASLSEAQRTTFASDAWSVGLRALMNAYRQAEEASFTDAGNNLVGQLNHQLRAYAEKQDATLMQTLAQYFDPKDGKVSARIDAFVRDGGELTRSMEKFLAPEHGALAQTLARELGAESPLLKRLSPTDSEGLLAMMETQLSEALLIQHESFTRALDPLAENGAVARFLATLREEFAAAETDRSKQLALATRALDANDESSLLSRLIRETQAARASVLQAMNPDDAASPLAAIRQSLMSTLERHAKTQCDAMAHIGDEQRKLATEIRDAVTRMEERKRGLATSSKGGAPFEEAVLGFVQRAMQGAPVVVEATGNAVGSRPNCKVGDLVVRFGSESIYAGAAFVIEVKRDASYSVHDALKELDVARSNRDSSSGLFVMAKSHARADFPTFARYGANILMVWDESDDQTDAYLHAALMLGLALTSRTRRADDAGNIEALADIESRIQNELNRHDRMKKMAENIRNSAEQLGEELRKGDDKMKGLLKHAKDTLKALNVELTYTAHEAQHPIQLAANSLESAKEGRNAA